MAGKESDISNKPTGTVTLYNPDNDKYYLATCDANGVLQIQGLVSGQIAIETGHGKSIENPASGTIASATTTAVIAAGGAGVYTYIFGYKVTGKSTTVNRVTLKHGTTQFDIVDIKAPVEGLNGINPQVEPDAWIVKSAANEAINIVTSSAESIDYQFYYWQDTV